MTESLVDEEVLIRSSLFFITFLRNKGQQRQREILRPNQMHHFHVKSRFCFHKGREFCFVFVFVFLLMYP